MMVIILLAVSESTALRLQQSDPDVRLMLRVEMMTREPLLS